MGSHANWLLMFRLGFSHSSIEYATNGVDRLMLTGGGHSTINEEARDNGRDI